MKQSVTLSVNDEIIAKMRDFYLDYMVPNDGQYVDFMAIYNNIIITAYKSKKELKKVTFIGDASLNEAKIWDINAKINEVKEKVKAEWLCLENQIGSDEVGVGDFLAPMIVVAAFVRKKDLSILKRYGVTDSKKMTDEYILSIGEELGKKFFISKLTLPNEKYNEMYAKGENLNSLKAKMHNRALLNMYKKFPDTKHIFVDQFVSPETYFAYLNDANEMQVRNITFRTKGESYYPSVALASVMARYSFLQEMKKLEIKYGTTIPLGASTKVNEFAKKFIEKFGLDEFNKICKKNFANYREVISISLL